jgi:phage shock protein A
MDVQHSTAPLLRQLESTERQNRARASAWAELETKLRSDVEEHVIQLEKLTKERNDLRASDKRLQRTLTEKEEELASSQETIDALTATIETLEEKVAKLEEKERHAKAEKDKLEKQASEGVSKIRSELTQSMIESEENYRSQIEALESEIADERQRRDNLMKQLDALAENVSTAEFSQTSGVSTGEKSSSEKEKRLLASTNQASILHDTLLGIDSDNDEDDEDDIVNLQGGSFAAMEQLSQGLRGAKLELEALRNQLALSEESRESLLAELAETRQAAEKLPLFESKVSELTMEVKLKDMEIEGLQEDIADVRFLYRQQLDALLEEKATEPHLTPLEEDEKASMNVDTD